MAIIYDEMLFKYSKEHPDIPKQDENAPKSLKYP